MNEKTIGFTENEKALLLKSMKDLNFASVQLHKCFLDKNDILKRLRPNH